GAGRGPDRARVAGRQRPVVGLGARDGRPIAGVGAGGRLLVGGATVRSGGAARGGDPGERARPLLPRLRRSVPRVDAHGHRPDLGPERESGAAQGASSAVDDQIAEGVAPAVSEDEEAGGITADDVAEADVTNLVLPEPELQGGAGAEALLH